MFNNYIIKWVLAVLILIFSLSCCGFFSAFEGGSFFFSNFQNDDISLVSKVLYPSLEIGRYDFSICIGFVYFLAFVWVLLRTLFSFGSDFSNLISSVSRFSGDFSFELDKNEIARGNYNSVLEQFCITKFSILVLSNSQFSFIGSFKAFIYKKLQKTFFGIKKLVQFFLSFFMPTVVSTKNIMFKRITVFCFKQYIRLLVKKKILVFWRCNSQVIKVRSTVLFQQMVKANFGLFYPFKNRLLNFTPMLNTIFIVILIHNFNGLLFYGLLIQHFYYKMWLFLLYVLLV